jgi:hypothetical protein
MYHKASILKRYQNNEIKDSEIIESSDSISDAAEGSIVMSKAFGRELCRVVCIKENEDMIIITVQDNAWEA